MWRQNLRLEKGVPHVVPDILGQYSSSAWSDVAVIVPWVVYQTYGDKGILEENWKCMHEWVDYIKTSVEKTDSGRRDSSMETGWHWIKKKAQTGPERRINI